MTVWAHGPLVCFPQETEERCDHSAARQSETDGVVRPGVHQNDQGNGVTEQDHAAQITEGKEIMNQGVSVPCVLSLCLVFCLYALCCVCIRCVLCCMPCVVCVPCVLCVCLVLCFYALCCVCMPCGVSSICMPCVVCVCLVVCLVSVCLVLCVYALWCV